MNLLFFKLSLRTRVKCKLFEFNKPPRKKSGSNCLWWYIIRMSSLLPYGRMWFLYEHMCRSRLKNGARLLRVTVLMKVAWFLMWSDFFWWVQQLYSRNAVIPWVWRIPSVSIVVHFLAEYVYQKSDEPPGMHNPPSQIVVWYGMISYQSTGAGFFGTITRSKMIIFFLHVN